MRQLLLALILVLPVCSSTKAATAGDVVFDKIVQDKCTRPDSALIKPGTSDKYNAQAKGFNDCLRIYVGNENDKIARIRAEASADFDRIMESSTSQIRDIERAINAAIFEVALVNGLADAKYQPLPGNSLASYPAAACSKPDVALLKPAPGKRVATIKNTDRYEDQRLAYEACMRTYVAQAKNQINQVQANAQADFHRVAEDANPRIAQINADVSEALNEASKASGERSAAVNAFHASLQAGGLDPAASQPGGLGPIAFQPAQNRSGTESVTVPGERLPRSADMPTGAGDPDAISCRITQQLTGSRLMGPEVCKHNRDWAKLFKRGESVSADGKQIVDAEKARTYNPQTCVTHTQIPSGALIVICSQGNQ
ncbi:MAG: hypothetical protein ABJB10_12855 [Mesorhizobium sp.]